MRKPINVPPPEELASFSPSELFKFYFQIGRWTEESFSDDLQSFTRGKLVSTVTISKWKNKNVIPTRYSGAFLKMVESFSEPTLAKEWTTAFETVWGLYSAGRTQSKPPTKKAAFSDAVCAQHREWIAQRYFQNLAGQSFSPADIYVPIQMNDALSDRSDPQGVEDIIDILKEADGGPDKTYWIFVSGRPGAGKSMTALHLAQGLCVGDLFPIYLRGSHFSNIDMEITDPAQPIGDAFSARSFLRHFRASSFNAACLILDGVDEIGREPHGTKDAFRQFMAELKTEQKACAAHNKKLWVIAFGRESHIQFASNQLSTAGLRHFTLRALDGSVRDSGKSSNSIPGEDLRALWWEKYLAAKEYRHDPSLPDFLATEYDDFSEFGTDPLLTFLICEAALEHYNESSPEKLPHEQVNALTYASNKNEIYKTILEQQAQSVRQLMDPKGFVSALQHIALAVWHKGDGRSVSLRTLQDIVDDPEIKASLQVLSSFGSLAKTPPNLLVAATGCPLSQNERQPEQAAIEFTHKTFSEYLISSLLLDRFTALISAFHEKTGFQNAFKDWIEVSKRGAHGPSFADFCQKEAATRFDSLSDVDWDAALTILKDPQQNVGFESSGLSLISDVQNSSSLLFFIWSCLNLERLKRTGEHFELPSEGWAFTVSNLKTIQRPNGLNLDSGSLIEPTLRDVSVLSQSISALHLKFADMSQLSFGLGHVESLICEDTSFAMTHWSHVKLTEARFERTLFQQAIFHHWRAVESRFINTLFQGSRFQGGSFADCHIEETYFSQCHFSDVEFDSSQFVNVVFDRCVFSECVFTQSKKSDPPPDAQFRHCTFMDMDGSLKNIPTKNISNPISGLKTGKTRSSAESFDL